ncbi:MAG: dihydrofolate reductase family protein [Paludibacter sp.]|nr:dihydrofolate reductase family protein [Paludibacter sp.]
MRKSVLYIAASLDGFIAKPNDDLSFLSIVEQAGEDYGYSDFLNTVDTIIIGRKTYDWVVNEVGEFPNAHLETYVITRTAKPDSGNIKFYSDDLAQLMNNLKQKSGKNIFIDGGAEIVTELLKKSLIDEVIISVIPVILGDGIRLFQNGIPENELKLIGSKGFEKGLVQLHYKIL